MVEVYYTNEKQKRIIFLNFNFHVNKIYNSINFEFLISLFSIF